MWEASGGIEWVPTGAYKVQILDMDPKQDGSSVFIRCKILDGPQAGKIVVRNIGLKVNEGNTRAWGLLYLSAGWPETALQQSFAPAGEGEGSPLGRTAYVTVASPPQSEAKELKMEDINVNFIRPESYKKRLTEGTAGGAAPAASGMAPSSPPPGLPPPPTSHTAAPPPPGGGPSLFGAPPNGAPAAGAASSAPPPPPPQ